MSIKWLRWQRSAMIVMLIGQMFLLGSSQFFQEPQTIWSGWWVAQQGAASLVWKTKRVRGKAARWSLWLREAIGVWRGWLAGKKLLWWLCYLLAIWAVGWVRLLRMVLSRMAAENVLVGEGNWGWTGLLSNQTTVMEVRLEVSVSEARGEERRAAAHSLLIEKKWEGIENGDGLEAIPQVSGEEVALAYLPAHQIEKCRLVAERGIWVEVGIEKAVDEASRKSETEEREQTPLTLIKQHFCGLQDPRMDRTKKHALFDIVTITICAVIGGADNWVEVAAFGQAKEVWLKGFLELPNGIPSHDTFGRVFRLLDPQQWQDGFLSWVAAITQAAKGQIVPIDGKALRRSHDKKLGAKAIHMVSAWASDSKVVLGQVKVDKKSNEITAIPTLLDMLTLSGCIVTIDAMGCQKEIARKIIAKGADYALALKGNQNGLYEGVQALFEAAPLDDFDAHHYHKTVEKNHGRPEIRHCWTISDPTLLSELHNFSAWQGLHTVVRVKAEQQRSEKTSTEERFYISSLSGDAEQMLQVVRGHWSIENNLHWVLDIAFREDECRIRKGYGAQNFAVLRHLVLNLLAQDTTLKCGTNAKRKKAGWDVNLLLDILFNST